MAFDQVSRVTTVPEDTRPRYVISVDYGTTYTGVAWVLTTGEPTKLSDINVVQNWPGGIGPKVPSTFTYSANTGEPWGYGIGDNAYVIRWTKLELEKPTRVDALEGLRQTLAESQQLGFSTENVLLSEIPRHLIMTSADVMTDYLTEVATCVRRDIESKKDKETLKDFPIDFVITHPAIWDSRAKNLTFRAVNKAFEIAFSDIDLGLGTIRLATEPEACAQFTMRVAQDEGLGNLRKGECFVVVDAGGGTVDLVSYRVEQVAPHFRVTRITQASSGGFGATCVDRYFLEQFLPRKLSPQDYDRLRAIGGPAERHGRASHVVLRRGEQIMLRNFERIKHKFAGPPERGQARHPQGAALDDVLELPPGIGLQDNEASNVRDGHLYITSDEMEEMFRESVDGTIWLISQQLVQVDRLRHKVKTIFLSGGFSQSEYLFKRVNRLAREWRFTLLRGDDRSVSVSTPDASIKNTGSWTAVAKGAVLMGLGLGCEVSPAVVKCPLHIGVVVASRFAEYNHQQAQKYTDTFDNVPRARDNIKWIVAKGDLVQDEGIERSLRIVKKATLVGNQTGSVTIVMSDYDGQGEPPSQYSNINDATRRIVNLDYDLGVIPTDQRNTATVTASTQSGIRYHKMEMRLEVTVNQRSARFDLLYGKTEDMLGNVGAPGFSIAPPITIDFGFATALDSY